MLSLIRVTAFLELLNALRSKLFGRSQVNEETLTELKNYDPVEFFTQIAKF